MTTRYQVAQGDRPAVWPAATLIGLLFAWPLAWVAAAHDQSLLIHSLTGDSYHYLAIARKSLSAHIYTYDGVTVTNGFHPLWAYFQRAMFIVLNLRSHEQQAIAAMWAAELSAALGVVFASAAIIRMTSRRWLGLLVVPGVFYLVAGVHVRSLSVWAVLDGMESAFSLMFGGIFFYVVSRYGTGGDTSAPRWLPLARALGLVLPWIILTRLDDVFLLPAFVLASLFIDASVAVRLRAIAWIVAPSCAAIALYLLYNRLTVGVAMPLSGGTKAGFVGFLSIYLLLSVHLPWILDIKSWWQHRPADGATVFASAFRFVEEAYPLIAGVFGAVGLRPRRRFASVQRFALFAVCLGGSDRTSAFFAMRQHASLGPCFGRWRRF